MRHPHPHPTPSGLASSWDLAQVPGGARRMAPAVRPGTTRRPLSPSARGQPREQGSAHVARLPWAGGGGEAAPAGVQRRVQSSASRARVEAPGPPQAAWFSERPSFPRERPVGGGHEEQRGAGPWLLEGRCPPRPRRPRRPGGRPQASREAFGTRRQVTGCFWAGAPEREPLNRRGRAPDSVHDCEVPEDKTRALQASMGGAAGGTGAPWLSDSESGPLDPAEGRRTRAGAAQAARRRASWD